MVLKEIRCFLINFWVPPLSPYQSKIPRSRNVMLGIECKYDQSRNYRLRFRWSGVVKRCREKQKLSILLRKN